MKMKRKRSGTLDKHSFLVSFVHVLIFKNENERNSKWYTFECKIGFFEYFLTIRSLLLHQLSLIFGDVPDKKD